MSKFEDKVLKKEKLDAECVLKVTKNEMSEKIFVEFSTTEGKLRLQKSFPDTIAGRSSAAQFEGYVKSIDDLKNHFYGKGAK